MKQLGLPVSCRRQCMIRRRVSAWTAPKMHTPQTAGRNHRFRSWTLSGYTKMCEHDLADNVGPALVCTIPPNNFWTLNQNGLKCLSISISISICVSIRTRMSIRINVRISISIRISLSISIRTSITLGTGMGITIIRIFILV